MSTFTTVESFYASFTYGTDISDGLLVLDMAKFFFNVMNSHYTAKGREIISRTLLTYKQNYIHVVTTSLNTVTIN